MNEDEQKEASWDELLQKAYKQGLPAGTTKIPKDIIAKILDEDDPWEKEEILAKVDAVVEDKAVGFSKEEYFSYSAYERIAQTPKTDGTVS